MSTFKFGADFFRSLNPPKEANLSASFATCQPPSPKAANASPVVSDPQKNDGAFLLQSGAVHNLNNGTLYDGSRPEGPSELIAQHQAVWKALTTRGGKFASAKQRLNSLSIVHTGAMMAIVRLVDDQNANTGNFLTFLGLPTTALEGSGATLKAEHFEHSDGQLMPLGLICPETTEPILTTVLKQTRDLTPAELKMKLWKHADSSLVLIDGEHAVEPILFPNTGVYEPVKAGAMGHDMFLQSLLSFKANKAEGPMPFRVDNGQPTNKDQVGLWYGARSVFFGSVHNLPLGFAMDPQHATSGKAIIAALKEFFATSESDDTWDFLDNQYVDAWCAAMVFDTGSFSQLAVSLEQVKTSWLGVTQPTSHVNVPFDLQATFAHMECALMYKLFRDGVLARSTKSIIKSLRTYEEILAQLFVIAEDDDEGDCAPPLGHVPTEMQPYAYYLVKAPKPTWEKKMGWSAFREGLPAPQLARRFALMEAPKSIAEAEQSQGLQLRKAPPDVPLHQSSESEDDADVVVVVAPEEESAVKLTRLNDILAGDWSAGPDEHRRTPLSVKPKSTRPVVSASQTAVAHEKLQKQRQAAKKRKSKKGSDSDNSSDSEASRNKKKRAKDAFVAQPTTPPRFQLHRGDDEESPTKDPANSPATTERSPTRRSSRSPYNPTVRRSITGATTKDQWVTPASLLGVLSIHTHGSQKISARDLIAVPTNRDVSSGFFSTHSYFVEETDYDQTILLTAHLLAYRLPDEARQILAPTADPSRRFASDWMMHSGNFGGAYHRNVLECKQKDLQLTAGMFLSSRAESVKSHLLPGTPDFHQRFFKLTEVLKPINKGAWNSGQHMHTLVQASYALSPFHFIASIDTGSDDELEVFRLPPSGLKANSMVKIIGNIFAFLHMMAEDERAFPYLPQGTSTFSLFSPLGGALCQALLLLQQPTIVTAWDLLHDKIGASYQTVDFLYRISDLFTLFEKWQQTQPRALHFQTGILLAPKSRDTEQGVNVSLLGTEVQGMDNDNLRLELADWATKLKKDFSAKKLKEQLATPITVFETDPPGAFAPLSQKEPQHLAQTRTESDSAAKARSRTKTPQPPAQPGARAPAQGQGQKSPSSKSVHGIPALVTLTQQHRSTNPPQTIGQILAQLKKAHGLDFPKLRGLPVCFPFVMECGCDNSHNTRRLSSAPVIPCTRRRHHVSIKDGDTEYGKEELRPLLDFLKNEHVAKQLLPTAAFTKFMS